MQVNRTWMLAAALALSLTLACDKGGDGQGGGAKKPNAGLTGGRTVSIYTFDSSNLDSDTWNNTAGGEGWVVEEGWLHSKGTRNKALWLKKPLPAKVRVEFDVRSESPDGDIKVEVFGDGNQHESGYILIFGGWRNKINTIARLDEHGRDRKEGAAGVQVEQSKVYKMAVVRTDNKVRWYLDRDKGELLLEYDDPDPLVGDRHAYFGFNDWSVPLYFDNLAVYDLEGSL